MTILLDLPKPNSPTFEVDHQIVVALSTLHRSLIRVRGAGRFGDHSASILLENDRDADAALAVLNSVGIHGTIRPDA